MSRITVLFASSGSFKNIQHLLEEYGRAGEAPALLCSEAREATTALAALATDFLGR